MPVTFAAIEETMNDMKMPYWRLKSRSGALIGYCQVKSTSVDASIGRLKKLLEGVTDDFVRVELSPNLSSENAGGKGAMEVIKMELDVSTMKPGVNGLPNNSSLERLVESIERGNKEMITLQKQLVEQSHKAKIDEMQRTIDGLKEADPLTKIIEGLAPQLLTYLPALLKVPVVEHPAQIAGVGAVSSALQINLGKIEQVLGTTQYHFLIEQLAARLEDDPMGMVEKIKEVFE